MAIAVPGRGSFQLPPGYALGPTGQPVPINQYGAATPSYQSDASGDNRQHRYAAPAMALNYNSHSYSEASAFGSAQLSNLPHSQSMNVGPQVPQHLSNLPHGQSMNVGPHSQPHLSNLPHGQSMNIGPRAQEHLSNLPHGQSINVGPQSPPHLSNLPHGQSMNIGPRPSEHLSNLPHGQSMNAGHQHGHGPMHGQHHHSGHSSSHNQHHHKHHHHPHHNHSAFGAVGDFFSHLFHLDGKHGHGHGHGHHAKPKGGELRYHFGPELHQPKHHALVLLGVRVLEIGKRTWTSALCGQLLAAQGAEVVRVAFDQSDATSHAAATHSWFHHSSPKPKTEPKVPSQFHFGKRLAPYKPDDPHDRTAMYRDLVAGADVILTDLTYDELELCGLDYRIIHERHPEIVYAMTTSIGEQADLSQKGVEDAGAFYCLSGIAEELRHHLGPRGLPAAVAASTLFATVCISILRRRCGCPADRADLSIFRTGKWCATFGAITQWQAAPIPKNHKTEWQQEDVRKAPPLPFDVYGAAHVTPHPDTTGHDHKGHPHHAGHGHQQGHGHASSPHFTWKVRPQELELPVVLPHNQFSQEKPLSRVVCIEISDEYQVSAAAVGRLLADMGARVTKVERPSRPDPWQKKCPELYEALKRDKTVDVVDYSHVGGKSALYRTLSSATMLLTNLPQRALDAWGLSINFLRENYPWLIIVHISTWGCDANGREHEHPGGRQGGEEVAAFWEASGLGPKFFMGSQMPPGLGELAVAQSAFAGVGLALLRQQRTNEGQYVHVSRYGVGFFSRLISQADRSEQQGSAPPLETSSPLLETADHRFIRLLGRGHSPHDIWALLHAVGKAKTNENIETWANMQAHHEELKKLARQLHWNDLAQAFREKHIDWFVEELRPGQTEEQHREKVRELYRIRHEHEEVFHSLMQVEAQLGDFYHERQALQSLAPPIEPTHSHHGHHSHHHHHENPATAATTTAPTTAPLDHTGQIQKEHEVEKERDLDADLELKSLIKSKRKDWEYLGFVTNSAWTRDQKSIAQKSFKDLNDTQKQAARRVLIGEEGLDGYWDLIPEKFRKPRKMVELEQQEDADWDKIPEAEQRHWIFLGWDKSTWDEGKPSPTATDTLNMEFRELPDTLQQAAVQLGYPPAIWKIVPAGRHRVRRLDACTWDKLPQHRREQWEKLEYDKASWDAEKPPTACTKTYLELTSAQKQAVQNLCMKREWDDLPHEQRGKHKTASAGISFWGYLFGWGETAKPKKKTKSRSSSPTKKSAGSKLDSKSDHSHHHHHHSDHSHHHHHHHHHHHKELTPEQQRLRKLDDDIAQLTAEKQYLEGRHTALNHDLQAAEHAEKWLAWRDGVDFNAAAPPPWSVDETHWNEALGGFGMLQCPVIMNGSLGATGVKSKKAEHVCLFPDLYVKKPTLQVMIKGAQSLRAPGPGQMPAVYCVCEIPGKPKSQFRTPTIASTSPTWEYEHTVQGFAVGDSLHFIVFAENTTHPRAFNAGDSVRIFAPSQTKLNGKLGTLNRRVHGINWSVMVEGESQPIELPEDYLQLGNARDIDEVLGWCQLPYNKFCPNGTDKPIALHQTAKPGSSTNACLMIHIPAIPVGAILQAESH